MRIACLQLAPKVGDVHENIARADHILARSKPDELENLDLLVLPEMAFTGYNFKSLEHISPWLEPTGAGITSEWARMTARGHGCTVAVGYPEKAEGEGERYNSLIVVDRDGKQLANYRKSFLYYTDATWAREGQGFYGGKLGDLGQVAMGICMDINPYKFEAPWDAYEFANHVLRIRARLVVLSMAWLTNAEQSAFTSAPTYWTDWETISYWIKRLEPIIQAGSSEETIVVLANRCGVEDEATYAGSSTVLRIKSGEVHIYDCLGRGSTGLLVVDTEEEPGWVLLDATEGPAEGEPGAPPAELERNDPEEDRPPKESPQPPEREQVDPEEEERSKEPPQSEAASRSADSPTLPPPTRREIPLGGRAARE